MLLSILTTIALLASRQVSGAALQCATSIAAAYTVEDPVNYTPTDNSQFSLQVAYSTIECPPTYTVVFRAFSSSGGANTIMGRDPNVLFDGTGTALALFRFGGNPVLRSSLSDSPSTSYFVRAIVDDGTSSQTVTFVVFSVTHLAAPATASVGVVRRRRSEQMPIGMSCPVYMEACNVTGKKGGWVCFDSGNSLPSCGGCPGSATSVDCTDIPNVADVSCIRGTCKIDKCAKKYVLNDEGTECVRE